MTRAPEIIEFELTSVDEIVRHMVLFSPDVEGRRPAQASGWINIRPAVDPEDLPPNGGKPGILSAVGPLVPLGTWTPASLGRRPTPPLIGLQHAAGGKARPLLRDRDHTVPDGWRVTQDESRRGLVVAVPPSVPHDEALIWLLGAADALCTVPFDGWVAAVYRR